MYNKQRELVKKAKDLGTCDEKIHRTQVVYAESWLFRVVAVEDLINNKGSETPGVDNMILTRKTTLEEKLELVE